MLSEFNRRLRNIFVTGLLVTLPVAFTVFILDFLFTHLDQSASPLFTRILILFGAPVREDFRLPGVGLLMTVLVIFFVGLLAANIFGKRLVEMAEAVVGKIPVAGSIYSGTKQVIHSIAQTDTNAFRSCALVEFPRRGVLTIGFVTGETLREAQAKAGRPLVNVFVPTTPNPTSGFLIFVPKEEIIPLEMSIEDGIKLIISGGIVVPGGPGKGELPKSAAPAGAGKLPA